MSRYDEKENESYEDRLVAFRTRSNGFDDKETKSIAPHFHHYSTSDRMYTQSDSDQKNTVVQSRAIQSFPVGVPVEVPQCVRSRTDVIDLFTPKSILKIIAESKDRARNIVETHFEIDDGRGAFGQDVPETTNGTNKVGVPHDYSLESVLKAIYRNDKDPLSVMLHVRSVLTQSLTERGRFPSLKDSREHAVDELANTRVHMACHADRVRSKELMLHSTDVAERFVFGRMRNASSSVRVRGFRKGSDDQQRMKIQQRWNDSASRHLVGATERLPSPSLRRVGWRN